jgi:DeoR family transcriptional regulator of aga operon
LRSVAGSERQLRICELLRDGHPVKVLELSRLCRTSLMTIRRDLATLEAEGKLRRVHGGAVPIRTPEYEPFFRLRAAENRLEKAAIGRTAASLVRDGEVIIVDVGTTLLELVKNLGQRKNITIITNWLPSVTELAKFPGSRTVILGGLVRYSELSIIGGMAVEALSGFNADRTFLGVGGVSTDKGITDYNLDEVEIKKSMIRAARQVVVLADHGKLDRVAPVRIGELSVVHTLVTGAQITDRQREALTSAGVSVVTAEAGPTPEVLRR